MRVAVRAGVVDQPSVSDDFGLRYLNLRTVVCFGGAASVGFNGF